MEVVKISSGSRGGVLKGRQTKTEAMNENEASRYNMYFIIRSLISASIGFITFSLVALLLGKLTGLQAIILSFVSFAYPVLLTNMFHRRIQTLVERILFHLEKHKRIEKLMTKLLK